MIRRVLPLIPALIFPLACSTDGEDSIYGDDGSGVTITASASGNSGSDDQDDQDDDAEDSSGSNGGPKLDLSGEGTGTGTAGDGGLPDGCQKVDFLFVIDNSGSMLEEQDNLAGSFPAFINSIGSTLDEAQDYHIMVVDTDAWVFQGCDINCFIPIPFICEGYECGVTIPMQCEDILGAGVTYPRGANASAVDCDFANGKRYMTEAEPDLVSTFQCAARVGTDSQSDPEVPMQAMVEAVNGPGVVSACNDGFLRDDAILVVTFITDEDDDPDDGSPGSVETWRQALIEAKNGDESSIVVLGLFGDGDLANGICGDFGSGGAETSVRLRNFLDSWGDNGVFGSICAADYDGFFQSAVDIIDTTCEDFTPPE